MQERKGLILINAYEQSFAKTERFTQELSKRGVKTDVARNDGFLLSVSDGKIKSDFPRYDFCLYLDKDKYVSHMLEKSGLRLFNSARAIELCDDKMTTHIALCGAQIPMPKTLPGLLCYNPSAKVDRSSLDRVISELGLPVIVKASYGSLGAGVFKADDITELKTLCEKLKTQSHLFQRYIKTSHGKDMRVIVIGGEPIGAIRRSSQTDFRSNLGLGGVAQKTELPDEVRDIAKKAAQVLGLDYCGIDFLYGENSYYLCEVNSNAYFDGFEKATGLNVAGAYAEHIVKSVYK